MRDQEADREPGRLAEGSDAGFSLIEVVIAASILFTIIAITGRFLLDSNRLLGTISVRADAEVKAAFLADTLAKDFRNCSFASIRPWYYHYPPPLPATTWPEYYNGSGYMQSFSIRVVDDFNGTSRLGAEYFYYWGNYQWPYESSITDAIDNDKDGRTDEQDFGRFVFPLAAFGPTDPYYGVPQDPNSPTASPSWSGVVYTKIADLASPYSPPATPAAPDWNNYGVRFSLVGRVLTIKVTTLKYDPTLQRQIRVSAESSVKLRN